MVETLKCLCLLSNPVLVILSILVRQASLADLVS
jgi:hypothetical protein